MVKEETIIEELKAIHRTIDIGIVCIQIALICLIFIVGY